MATVVTGIAKLATFVLAAVFQLCVMCPAAAAGIATFAAAHQLVFPDMGNTLLAEYVEGYFPIIAGVGAAVLTLVLTSKLSLEAIKLADDADKSWRSATTFRYRTGGPSLFLPQGKNG